MDLENRFDARIAQIETNIRSALVSSASCQSLPAPVAPPAQPAPVAVPTTVLVPPQFGVDNILPAIGGHSSRSPDREHRSSRHGLPDSARSSSSTSRSSSSSGSSSSRSRSRSSDHKRKHRKCHGKYSTIKYLPEFKSTSTYERLVLANLRFYKKERDINGMLNHFILLAKKAEKDVFIDEALLSHDRSVKDGAKEHGLKEFSTLNPSENVKHLSYDGTKAGSVKGSRKAAREQS